MATKATKQELLAAARAGEDIDDRPGVGKWETSTQPMVPSAHPDGTVLVGRSLRMSMDTYQRIKTAATSRGTTWSAPALNFLQPLLRFVTETDVDVVMVAGRWTLADRSAAPFLARARALASAYRRHGVELPHAAIRFK